jgi:hypothetical protein
MFLFSFVGEMFLLVGFVGEMFLLFGFVGERFLLLGFVGDGCLTLLLWGLLGESSFSNGFLIFGSGSRKSSLYSSDSCLSCLNKSSLISLFLECSNSAFFSSNLWF